MKKQDFVGHQDRVNVAPAMNRFGHQDSASAPTAQHREKTQDSASDVSRSQAKITTKEPGQRKRPHHPSPPPCPYIVEMWHRIIGGTSLPANHGAFEREV